MSSFTIDASCDGRALTLACRGELDAGSCAVLREAIAAHAATGVACVVLDLSALEFIDSSGINALIIGNYLTYLGRSPQEDLKMLDDLRMPVGALSKVL